MLSVSSTLKCLFSFNIFLFIHKKKMLSVSSKLVYLFIVCIANFFSTFQSHASQILGFKYQYYQRMEVNNRVPPGLYQLTALLVKEEFIDLDSM